VGKHDGNHKIALSSEEDRATVTVTYRENFAKLGHVIFELWKQTDRHTDTHPLQYLSPILVGKVMT